MQAEITPLSRRSALKKLLKLAGAGISGTAVSGLLGACGGGVGPTPTATATPAPALQPRAAATPGATGGELRIATTTEGVTLHPFKFTDTPSQAYIDQMFSMPLLDYDRDDLELRPMAAASIAESSDHRVLTFTLRDNLQWSDGKPLTAADYAWTWSQATRKENGWPRLGSYQPYIESVQSLDARTLDSVRAWRPVDCDTRNARASRR